MAISLRRLKKVVVPVTIGSMVFLILLAINEISSTRSLHHTSVKSHIKTKTAVKWKGDTTYKKILFWGIWHDSKWEAGFGPTSAEGLRQERCPTWQCLFTYDKSQLSTADVVVVRIANFKDLSRHQRPPGQRWMIVDIEPPGGPKGDSVINVNHQLVNWTYFYHTSSDVQGGNYGHFVPLDNSYTLTFEVKFITAYPDTLKSHQEALDKNLSLEEILGSNLTPVAQKPKMVAWMISNCWGRSGRKDYVDELMKYIPIDIYGKCTKKNCLNGRMVRHPCWKQVLSWQYTFYLAFENTLCDEYVTEKTYYAYTYNVIPIVYGAVDYKNYLPPNSYIDARDYHPKDLAKLIENLHNDPVALGRYQIWRGFWKVKLKGSFCHLCHKLYEDPPNHHYTTSIDTWHHENGKCHNPTSKLFNNISNPNACHEFIRTNASCIS